MGGSTVIRQALKSPTRTLLTARCRPMGPHRARRLLRATWKPPRPRRISGRNYRRVSFSMRWGGVISGGARGHADDAKTHRKYTTPPTTLHPPDFGDRIYIYRVWMFPPIAFQVIGRYAPPLPSPPNSPSASRAGVRYTPRILATDTSARPP